MKLDSTQKQALLDFISENWNQFVEHMASREPGTDEEVEEKADAIHEGLTEEVMYG
ncbi:MAG: hypothetical protein ACRC8B_22705 [Aeromonas sobria]|uniref:hypothetical protein n=1 Tax=Aeromonas sobria TaxID=646 RepID=UPI003F3B1630